MLSGLKGTSAETLGRATRTATAKQAMVVFPQDSNLQPSDYRSTARPLELKKTSPGRLNFGYLNPATLLFCDVNNNLIVMF